MTLKLIAIGALGNMLGPASTHLRGSENAQFLRILDRGASGGHRDAYRQAWRDSGAILVDNLAALVADGAFDGVVICAGKNGDDYPIIRALIPLLAQHGRSYFILHLSTVSCAFVTATAQFCAQHHINYANYPLTGGAKGAETARMLILCSGDPALFERVTPLLQQLGVPRYFGDAVERAAAVKLIGHVLVFQGLLGVSLAISLQRQVFQYPTLQPQQAEFFDFLNQGAGGSKQWDVAVRPGIVNDDWGHGFLLRHAAVDIIYTLQLLLEQQQPKTLCLPLVEVSLLFSYLLNKYPHEELCTQAVTRLLGETHPRVIDNYLRQYISADMRDCLEHCIFQLPEALRRTLLLEIRY